MGLDGREKSFACRAEMIYLVTGQPGAGKTLYALNWVKAFAADRQVIYSGIPELMLPWAHLEEAKDWHKQPDGSVIVIDECQRLFRPRSMGAVVPDYVSALETHRHRGMDLVLITQDPMLVDVVVRRLVGTHFHVNRVFGTHTAKVHEWQGVKDQCGKASSRSDSVGHVFRYPKESFRWYKSAEVHTHKVRIPMRMFFLVIAPIIFIGLGYSAVKWLGGDRGSKHSASTVAGQTAPATLSPGAGKKDVTVLSPLEYVAQRQPRIAGLAYSAPVYDKLTEPVVAPVPSACVKSHSKGCRCFSQQGTPMEVPQALCETIVAGGFFVDFDAAGKVNREQIAQVDQGAPGRVLTGAAKKGHDGPAMNLDAAKGANGALGGPLVGDLSPAKQTGAEKSSEDAGSQPQPSAIRNGSDWAFKQ